MASQNEKQLVQVPFAAGIDERARVEHVDAQSFTTLENVRQVTKGAYGKRNGFTAMTLTRAKAVSGSSTTRSAGKKMVDANGTPGVIDGTHLDVWSPAAAMWSTVDRVPNCMVTRKPIISTAQSASAAISDIAYVNGYYAVLTLIASATYSLSIIDPTTGVTVMQPTTVGSGGGSHATAPKLAVLSNRLMLVYARTVGTIILEKVDCTSAATIATGVVNVATLATTYDAAAADLKFAISVTDVVSNQATVVYKHTTGPNYLAFVTFSMTGLSLGPTVHVATVGSTVSAFAVAGPLDVSDAFRCIWLSWREDAGAGAVSYSVRCASGTSHVTVGTTYTISIGASWAIQAISLSVTTTAKCLLVADASVFGVGYNSGRFRSAEFEISGGACSLVLGSDRTLYNARLVGNLFAVGTRRYCIAAPLNVNLNQKIAHVVEIDFATTPTWYGFRCAGTIAARQLAALADPTGVSRAASVAMVSATKAVTHISTSRNAVAWANEIAILDFAQQEQWSSANVADAVHFGGGVPFYSDGGRCVEMGFLDRPMEIFATLSGTGITGTYKYILIWERVDGAGNVHWSGLSDPVTTSPVNQTVTLTFPPSPFSSQWGPAGDGTTRAVAYRTEAGGSTYYRCGETVVAYLGPVYETRTIADSMADATLITKQQLYRQISVSGAPLNRQCPPCLRYLKLHNDRLFGVADDLISVWHSAKHVLGEGMWFSDLFQFPVEEGGRIYGLASMDGRLYIFKRNRIFVVDGDGPSENGASGDFTLPSKLPAAIGCIDHRSIVETPVGIFFQSDRGLELLARGGEMSWVGERVQATLALYPIITSAVVDADDSLVLFTCVATETDASGVGTNGVTLAFDYSSGEWVSVDKITQGATATAAAQGACMASVGGAPIYYRLAVNGTVYYDDAATYLDSTSTWVTAKATTGWLKASGLQGIQEFTGGSMLASYATDHNLAVSLDFNYLTSAPKTRTYTRAEIAVVQTAVGREHLDLMGTVNSTGMAVRATLTDATPTGGTVGTGQGATWIGLAFEVAPKPGRNKAGSTAR